MMLILHPLDALALRRIVEEQEGAAASPKSAYQSAVRIQYGIDLRVL